MCGDPTDEELEDLRQEKMEQLKEQQAGEGGEEAMLKQALTDGARKRLNTVQMSKPEFGEKVEQQVVALAQSGRLQGRIDEEKMKQILDEMKPDSKSYDIRRR